MSFFGDLFGSSPPPTQTTQNVPSAWQQMIMNPAVGDITNYLNQGAKRYPGSTVADFTAPQQLGQSMALGAAGNQQELANQGNTTTGNWLSMNPDAQEHAAIDAAVRPIYQNLTQQTLPAIRSDAESTGNFGGSRQGVSEGLASQSASQAAGDAAAKVASNVYSTNTQAQLQALGLLPQTQQANLAPATTTSGVGDVQQQQNQEKLTEQANNYQFDNGLGNYMLAKDALGIASGLPGGTTTSTGSVPQSSSTQALGTGIAGLTLASQLAPKAGTAISSLLPFLFA